MIFLVLNRTLSATRVILHYLKGSTRDARFALRWHLQNDAFYARKQSPPSLYRNLPKKPHVIAAYSARHLSVQRLFTRLVATSDRTDREPAVKVKI